MIYQFVKNRILRRLVNAFRNHIVIGIETTCDETGISVINQNGSVLSDVCRSQLEIHVSNGGIIPTLARTLHRNCIDQCVHQSLTQANISATDLTAIAVAVKPGLPLSLLVGMNYAKALALKYKKPLIPIHHMEAHALIALMNNNRWHNNSELDFPFVTLLISGGHCLIAVVKDINCFMLLGQSVNDAPGDILDKTARRLKLKNLGSPYNKISGGAAVELSATFGNPYAFFKHFPDFRPYNNKTCDFSFTSFNIWIDRVIEELEKESNLDPDTVLPQAHDISASVQYTITYYLIKRLQRAFIFIEQQNLMDGNKIKLVISGGCACNDFITKAIRNFCKSLDIEVFVPQKKFCSDNGVMIAWNGVLKLKNEHKFPHTVLRDESDIKNVDMLSKAPFGEDLTSKVREALIKCKNIDVKQFVCNNY